MKKIISVFAALAVAVSFAGCTKEDDSGAVIEIPILDAEQETYNTAVVEISDISQSYKLEGDYSFPYTRTITIKQSGAIRELNYDPDVEVSEGDLILAIDTTEVENQISDLEGKIKDMKNDLERLKNSGASQTDIDMAQVDIEIEENNLDKLLGTLEEYTIFAPCDGFIEIVGSADNFQVGTEIVAGQSFGTIVDRSRKQLTANSRVELENVGYGTKVEVTQGNIGPVSGMVTDVIGSDNGRMYSYVISLDDETVEFYEFSTVDVNFKVYEKQDVVSVPVSAIVNVGDRTFVYTVVNGIRMETTVELGITDDLHGVVEVISGLSGGETIVVG